jgi:hypothetical protein
MEPPRLLRGAPGGARRGDVEGAAPRRAASNTGGADEDAGSTSEPSEGRDANDDAPARGSAIGCFFAGTSNKIVLLVLLLLLPILVVVVVLLLLD